jgi:NADH-quinone oxidoreductase subunit E
MILSEQSCNAIDKWLQKYPADQKQSAVLPALHIVQEEQGYLSREVLDAVAHYLDMSPIAVYEVASFYSMFELSPVGKHKINICTNVSCMLRGSEKIVKHCEHRLGIKLGETTPDGKFTLRSVECLAACVGAPVCQVDKEYHENLTPEKIDAILDGLKS